MIVKQIFYFVLMSAFLAMIMHVPSTSSSLVLRPIEVGFPLSSSPSNTWPTMWGGNAIFEKTVPHHRRWRRAFGSRRQTQSESLGSKSLKSKFGLMKQYAPPMENKQNDEEPKMQRSKSWKEKIISSLTRVNSKVAPENILVPSKMQLTEDAVTKIEAEIYRLSLEMVMTKMPEQLKKKKELLKIAIYIKHALQIAKKLSDTRHEQLEKAKAQLREKEVAEKTVETKAKNQEKVARNERRQLERGTSAKESETKAPKKKKQQAKNEEEEEEENDGKKVPSSAAGNRAKKGSSTKAKGKEKKDEEKEQKAKQKVGKIRQKQLAEERLKPFRSTVVTKQTAYNNVNRLKNNIKRFFNKTLKKEEREELVNFGNEIFYANIRNKNSMIKNELLAWETKKIASINEEDIDLWTNNNLTSHPLIQHAGKLEQAPEFVDHDTITAIRAFMRLDVVLDREARIQCLKKAFGKLFPTLGVVAEQHLNQEEIQHYFINPLMNFHGLKTQVENLGLPGELPLYKHYFEANKNEKMDEELEKCKNDLFKEPDSIQESLDCMKDAIFHKISEEALRKHIKKLEKDVEKKAIEVAKKKEQMKTHGQPTTSNQKRTRKRDKFLSFFTKRRERRGASSNSSEEDPVENVKREKQLEVCKSRIAHKDAKRKLKNDKKNLKISKSQSKKLFSFLSSKSSRRSFKLGGHSQKSFRQTLADRLTTIRDAKTNEHFMRKLSKEIVPFVQKRTKSSGDQMPASYALDIYLEVFARLEFAKGPGKCFLDAMVELSKSMTMTEVQKCNKHFTKTISGFSAEENDETIDANGEGAEFDEYDDAQQHKDGGGQPPTHGDANDDDDGAGEEEEEEESGLDNDDGYGGGERRRKGPAHDDEDDDDGGRADKHQQQRHTDDSDQEQGYNDGRHGKPNDDEEEEDEVQNDDEEEEEEDNNSD